MYFEAERWQGVARPSIVAGQKYEEVTRAYIGTLHPVQPVKGRRLAAAELEKELMEITGFKRGLPSTLEPASERGSD
jgi:hypothetical protein